MPYFLWGERVKIFRKFQIEDELISFFFFFWDMGEKGEGIEEIAFFGIGLICMCVCLCVCMLAFVCVFLGVILCMGLRDDQIRHWICYNSETIDISNSGNLVLSLVVMLL